MKPVAVKVFAVIWVIVLIAGPAHAKLTETQRAEFVTSFIEHHVVPRYTVLASRISDMNAAAQSFCTSPSSDRLLAMREAFSAAYLSWMSVQHIRFGSALEGDAHYRFQFWPDKHGQGAKQIRRLILADTPVPEAMELAEGSVALQGFPALERVLFADDKALLAGDAKATRRCALIRSISANLKSLSQTVLGRWTENRVVGSDAALGEIVRVYLEQLQTITELKIKRPLGKSREAARPKRAEAWRSSLSFAAIEANLKALRAVYSGEGGWSGFAPFLASDEETQSMASAIEEHFAYGAKVVSGQPSTLRETVQSEDGRRTLAALIGTVDEIREFSFAVLPEALGVTLGFNSLDGD